MRVLAGRYELGELLGSGGMADVYRATDLVLGRAVAVKVLRTGTEAAPAARARFDAEPLLLAALSHPGLVMVLDAGADGQDAYLVMELLDGPTLAARLRARGPMAPAEVTALGAALADALAVAHERGVVHRDVKPSNIVLCEARPVLTDFGIARYVSDAADLTAAGEVIGSPAYLAPEQVNGLEATPAVDVYALGLVLLEACTGSRAYPGPPLEAAVARLAAPPAVPVSLDRPLRDLLTRMVASDPVDRPTMAAVAAALAGPAAVPGAVPEAEHTAVLDLSEITQATGTVAVAGNRRRRPVALLAAAAVAAACLGLVAVDQLTPDEVAAVEEPPPSPSATPTGTPTPTPAVQRAPTQTADQHAKAKAKPKPKAKSKAKSKAGAAGSKGKPRGHGKKAGKPAKGG